MKPNNKQSEFLHRQAHNITRRYFFSQCGVGLGKMALGSLLTAGLSSHAFADTTHTNPLAPKQPHFAPKAKRVIYLMMAGAPSQLDLFDKKPQLQKHHGKPIPAEIVKDQRYAFIQRDATLLAPVFPFKKVGQSGAEISSILPHLAKVADEIAIVKSMHTDQFNHAPAQIFFNTGGPQPGRPSMGAWVTYGLGAETNNLPAYVVLSTGGGTSGGAANWSSGFMPSTFAGVPFRSKGDPILNVRNPDGVDDKLQRDTLDLISQLNKEKLDNIGDPTIKAKINAYETAFRMQTAAPELMDIKSESQATLDLYGAKPGKSSFANNCLLARRLIERGVRFVSVNHKGWDHHSNVKGGLQGQCGQTDQASAALILDLKQRGLLEDTLVIWGGEFGRTPMVESNAALGRSLGRDHHPQAYTMWLAGGGIKQGITIGETDDLGFHITKDPVHVHDMQATILNQLGLNHEKLTYTYQGRKFRLTDVHGKLINKIIA